MKRIIEMLIDERTVVAIILLNTVALIAVGYTDPQLALPDVPRTELALLVYSAARWVDYACVVYFVLEVVLKVRTVNWARYWASPWNRFDFTVVLLSSPVLLSHFIDVGDLSIVLVLRLGRLFRLFRVMRFIPNREHLWAGIKRALRASVGVFLALLVVNVVLSLGATQLFGRQAPEYFGNPAMSSYSLFRVFTVEGWYEIPDYVAAHSHPAIGVLARLYFIVAVLGGGILGLSLANAVFVDEMTIDNNEDVEAKVDLLLEEVRELRKALGERPPS